MKKAPLSSLMNTQIQHSLFFIFCLSLACSEEWHENDKFTSSWLSHFSAKKKMKKMEKINKKLYDLLKLFQFFFSTHITEMEYISQKTTSICSTDVVFPIFFGSRKKFTLIFYYKGVTPKIVCKCKPYGYST